MTEESRIPPKNDEPARSDNHPTRLQSTAQRVPLLDLKLQYRSIKPEVDLAVARVIESQQFIGGPEVEALESEIAGYCGAKFAVGVSSGTDALLASLMALDVGPGDEVVTTPFSFFATVGSVLRLGAVPVFADIEPESFNIDPAKVGSLLTSKTKAIIPVHLFGQCADMDPIVETAKKFRIPIIEDAAQAIGAEYKGKRAGSMGTFGCFSFFPSKNLGAFGDGGVITTNDEDLAERVKILRNHGAHPKYIHKIIGGNFRLDAIQAAVLRVKLRYLDAWTAGRQKNADFYTRGFTELGLSGNKVQVPRIIGDRHIFNQYVIRVENRDQLRDFLKENGVDTEIYYPKALHLQECMPAGRFKAGEFPAGEKAAGEVLALPIYPELLDTQKQKVLSTISEFYSC